MQVTYDRSWRLMTDADLSRTLAMHRRALALVEEENPDPDIRESTRQYLATLIEDAEAEDARRQRCVRYGIPRDTDPFPRTFLLAIKSRVQLDQLCEYELGARLGKESHGVRRGPCPFCKPSEHSDCFLVHIEDADDQWFYCHRCLSAGDCFTAIMHGYGLEFPQAVERLAKEGGLSLPTPPTPPARTKTPAKKSGRVVLSNTQRR
jgi:hypothetical protein